MFLRRSIAVQRRWRGKAHNEEEKKHMQVRRRRRGKIERRCTLVDANQQLSAAKKRVFGLDGREKRGAVEADGLGEVHALGVEPSKRPEWEAIDGTKDA